MTNAEEVVKTLKASHNRNKPDIEILKKLAKENPGTTIDYWLGYFYGVAEGYEQVLKNL